MLQPWATISEASQSSNSGCDGSTAVEPEVAGRLDQTRAEVGLPETVDHDPGEERVFRAGDPVRQLLAASDRRVGREPEIGGGRGHGRDPAGRDHLAGLAGVAPDQDPDHSHAPGFTA